MVPHYDEPRQEHLVLSTIDSLLQQACLDHQHRKMVSEASTLYSSPWLSTPPNLLCSQPCTLLPVASSPTASISRSCLPSLDSHSTMDPHISFSSTNALFYDPSSVPSSAHSFPLISASSLQEASATRNQSMNTAGAGPLRKSSNRKLFQTPSLSIITRGLPNNYPCALCLDSPLHCSLDSSLHCSLSSPRDVTHLTATPSLSSSPSQLLHWMYSNSVQDNSSPISPPCSPHIPSPWMTEQSRVTSVKPSMESPLPSSAHSIQSSAHSNPSSAHSNPSYPSYPLETAFPPSLPTPSVDPLVQPLFFLPPKQDTVQCPICNKDFYLQDHLNAHLRHHQQEAANTKRFHCHYCNMSFVRKHDLHRHFKIHQAKPQYFCQRCGKGFIRSDMLKRHENLKEESKQFKCIPLEK